MPALSGSDQVSAGDYFTHPSTSETITFTVFDISETIASGTTHSGSLLQSDLTPPDNESTTNIIVNRDV